MFYHSTPSMSQSLPFTKSFSVIYAPFIFMLQSYSTVGNLLMFQSVFMSLTLQTQFPSTYTRSFTYLYKDFFETFIKHALKVYQ